MLPFSGENNCRLKWGKYLLKTQSLFKNQWSFLFLPVVSKQFKFVSSKWWWEYDIWKLVWVFSRKCSIKFWHDFTVLLFFGKIRERGGVDLKAHRRCVLLIELVLKPIMSLITFDFDAVVTSLSTKDSCFGYFRIL